MVVTIIRWSRKIRSLLNCIDYRSAQFETRSGFLVFPSTGESRRRSDEPVKDGRERMDGRKRVERTKREKGGKISLKESVRGERTRERSGSRGV